MDKIYLRAPAKINLVLNVLSRREDEYHNISSIMQSISLFDDVVIEKTNAQRVKLITNYEEIPRDENNLVYKIAEDIIYKYKIKKGVNIKIFKRIPVGAGLAGGSSDCAAALKGMLVLFKIDIPKSDIYKICEQYGADVPFCYEGGTVLATGIGNVLHRLPAHPHTHIVLVKPNFSTQTKNLYEEIDYNQDYNQIIKNQKDQKEKYKNNIRNMIRALKYGDVRTIALNFYNDFEDIVANTYPVIHEIKYTLINSGALGANMTGTGSVVFAYFDSFALAKKSTLNIKKKFPGFDTYLARNLGQY